jgi:adenylate cyclase
MPKAFSRRHWREYGAAIRFAAILGLTFGVAAGAAVLRPPLMGALFGAVSTVTDFVTGMAMIGALEIFVPRTALGRRLLARPFLVVVLVKAAAYLAVVGLLVGVRLGPSVAALVGDPRVVAQVTAQLDAGFPRGLRIVVVSLLIFLLVMLRHAGQLVGERTFREIMRGRYHRPRSEERFFLFVDVVGSTPVAERLGPHAVHCYLDRVFRIASEPVDAHYGEVYQYVGDEMVVSWTLAEGRPEARPLACLFSIEAALAAATPEFERDFGAVPKIRAALHAGEVVTGEIGGTRRSLVFHGDVMNATSRIENLTRELGRAFLVSEDALGRTDGAAAYQLEDLGLHQLRGREALVRVYAASMVPAREARKGVV